MEKKTQALLKTLQQDLQQRLQRMDARMERLEHAMLDSLEITGSIRQAAEKENHRLCITIQQEQNRSPDGGNNAGSGINNGTDRQ